MHSWGKTQWHSQPGDFCTDIPDLVRRLFDLLESWVPEEVKSDLKEADNAETSRKEETEKQVEAPKPIRLASVIVSNKTVVIVLHISPPLAS